MLAFLPANSLQIIGRARRGDLALAKGTSLKNSPVRGMERAGWALGCMCWPERRGCFLADPVDISEEQRLRLLVNAVTDYAIYMLDPTGRIATWNPGAQRFKGYSSDEVIGEHFSR